MHEQYNTNIYGYWQYIHHRGLGCGVEKYDLVYVFKVKNDMVHAVNEKGKVVSFSKTIITDRQWFKRPSYKYHIKCDLGIRSSQFYKTLIKSEHHKNDCPECQMYKFKQIVKKFLVKKNNE